MVEEPPKAELVKGKIWHEAHEAANNAEEHIVSSVTTENYQDILDIYRKHYSKMLRNAIIQNKSGLREFGISMIDIFKEYWTYFEDAARDRALNVSEFASKNHLSGKELWASLTPKLLSEQRFKSERLNLSGIIDVLEIHDIGGETIYVPLELKTGKYPDKGMWDGHRIQLAAYMLLLEDSGKKIGDAVIKYQGAEKRLLHMNPFLKSEVLDLIQKTDGVLKSREIPDFTDNANKCRNCHFKDKCHNPDAMKTLLVGVSERLKKP